MVSWRVHTYTHTHTGRTTGQSTLLWKEPQGRGKEEGELERVRRVKGGEPITYLKFQDLLLVF